MLRRLNFATLQQQVQEMLFIEQGGMTQLMDELEAYDPLILQGSELSTTVMFEIADPMRRAATLARLGGIEHHALIDLSGVKLRGEPDPTRKNTSPEGKASSVQFVKFRFASNLISRFKAPGAEVWIGFDHPNYTHVASRPEPVREALAEDLD